MRTVKANERAGTVSTFSAEKKEKKKNVSSCKHRTTEWRFQSFSVFLLPKEMPTLYRLQVCRFQNLFHLEESLAKFNFVIEI